MLSQFPTTAMKGFVMALRLRVVPKLFVAKLSLCVLFFACFSPVRLSHNVCHSTFVVGHFPENGRKRKQRKSCAKGVKTVLGKLFVCKLLSCSSLQQLAEAFLDSKVAVLAKSLAICNVLLRCNPAHRRQDFHFCKLAWLQHSLPITWSWRSQKPD